MGRNKKYENIILKDGDREILEKIARSQTTEYRKVQRARNLLGLWMNSLKRYILIFSEVLRWL